MIYKNGYDPNQIEMMCLESEVPMDSPARVISAFVEEVVKGKVSFTKRDRKNFGRLSFDPPFYDEALSLWILQRHKVLEVAGEAVPYKY